MSKYADIEQIKKTIREEWVKYMPMELDVSLSFVLGKISEVPTIEVSEDCISREMVAKRLAELWETEHPEKSYDEWLEIANKWCDYFPPSVVPQVPSGDCISRAYAIEVLSHVKKDEQWRTECIDNEIRLIKLLPSVAPSRAEGEWINKQEKYQMAECSNCKKVTMHEMWGDKLVYYDYCPNCGAKMKG